MTHPVHYIVAPAGAVIIVAPAGAVQYTVAPAGAVHYTVAPAGAVQYIAAPAGAELGRRHHKQPEGGGQPPGQGQGGHKLPPPSSLPSLFLAISFLQAPSLLEGGGNPGLT